MDLPEKGIEIKAQCDDGETRFLFRCACKSETCQEYRCSITGFALIVNVINWEYVNYSQTEKK